MKEINVVKLLENKAIQEAIEANLSTPGKMIVKAINWEITAEDVSATVSEDKNFIYGKVTDNGKKYSFQFRLYTDKSKNEYLLECRLVKLPEDTTSGVYLQVFTSEGDIIKEEIDDVWAYADWKECMQIERK